MHIAHLQNAEFISVEELAKTIGLKRRQIAQLARDGKIPGAIRPDGYHYVYPLTRELLHWIKWKCRQVERRKHPNSPESRKIRKDQRVTTIRGIRAQFDVWIRRVGGLDGILKMKPEYQQEIMGEIRPILRVHSRIIQMLRAQR
jgi:hypothetical protein